MTTHTTFEVTGLVKVDEEAGVVFYTARDGDNHMKVQLHRVGLDGKGDVRLTDPAFNHTVGSCMSSPAAGGGRGGFGGASAVRHLARQQVLSSTSIRRTTLRRRRGSSTPTGRSSPRSPRAT